MKRTLLLAVIVGGCLVGSALAATRKWTFRDATPPIFAELVKATEEKVVLKRTNGKTLEVPISNLSNNDRHYLGTLGKHTAAGKTVSKTVSYARDVQPLLAHYCVGCHNATKRRGGYAVDSFAALTQQGKKGALIVAGRPDQSWLVLSMQGQGKAMPPRKSPQPNPAEIAKIADWIKAGAVDDTQRPKPPRK